MTKGQDQKMRSVVNNQKRYMLLDNGLIDDVVPYAVVNAVDHCEVECFRKRKIALEHRDHRIFVRTNQTNLNSYGRDKD